jgi:plastocyanin
MVICLAGISMGDEETKADLEVISTIVTISTFDGIMPAMLKSKPGTTVVWLNRSRIPAEVLFLDKKVTVACGSPVNFFIGKDGAYESGKIISRGTASLCFTEKGTYEYVVKSSRAFYKPGEKEYRGSITIE